MVSLTVSLTPVDGATADEEGNWDVRRSRDGIEVATRPVEDSPHAAVRARMTVAATVSEVVGLLKDASACEDWAAYCADARLVAAEDETEAWVWTHNDMPWPVRDREVVTHVTWRRDPATGAVHMRAQAVPGRVAVADGHVRLEHAWSRWTITPVEDGVEVVCVSHADPGSPLPAWITNRMLVDAPWESFERVRTLVRSGRYADATFAFIGAAPGD